MENQNPLPGTEGDIYLNPLNMVPAQVLLQQQPPKPPGQ